VASRIGELGRIVGCRRNRSVALIQRGPRRNDSLARLEELPQRINSRYELRIGRSEQQLAQRRPGFSGKLASRFSGQQCGAKIGHGRCWRERYGGAITGHVRQLL
jgi:hypothetical protein